MRFARLVESVPCAKLFLRLRLWLCDGIWIEAALRNASKPLCSTTVGACYLEPSLPSLKFSPLLFSPCINDFFIKRKVQVKVEPSRHLLPYASPYGVIVAPAATWRSAYASTSGTVPRARPPVDRRGHSGKISIVLHVNNASFAIPDFGSVVEAGAEDVDRTVAAVAVHGTMSII
jgi:hypothetical protein